jgi:DNA repair protein RecO (recombination protein O)
MYFLQPAYILHTRPYRDTSLLIDFFTKNHGTIRMVARGIKSAKSPLKGLLQPFIPLLISFSWKRELALLTHAEIMKIHQPLVGKYLFSGLYINELLMKLLQQHDAHPELYQHYEHALQALSTQINLQIPLRRFEKNLLAELGYGLDLTRDAITHQPIALEQFYQFLPQRGFILDIGNRLSNAARFSGKALLALARENFADHALLNEMRQLLRFVIADLLGNRVLKSRDLFGRVDLARRDS